MGHVEREQLLAVEELAREHGVLFHHCVDSRRCLGQPGFLDLVLAGPGGVTFPELKASPGLTGPQTMWRWTLRAAGAVVPIWLPSDFRDGTVEREIARLGHR